MITLKIIFFIFYLFFQDINCFHFLHITFHKGCAREIEYVAQELNIELTTLLIPESKPYSFDPLSHGNVLYNMTKERADRIWTHVSNYFNQFDALLISDTTPLSRIFLQNHWKKPLIIWVCNRFDYADQETFDGEFPDQNYYDLIQEATTLPNIQIVCYTAFEHTYAQLKGVQLEKYVIQPSRKISELPSIISCIPDGLDKQKTFFIPPYHNDTYFINLQEHVEELNISCYRGRYNGPEDLQVFKGIIHIPYAWSTFAFFENMQLGIPYFIPSYDFLKQLVSENPSKFFHQEAHIFLNLENYKLSEFYNGQHPNIIYFDSWQDLQQKIKDTDFNLHKEHIKQYAENHRKQMSQKWENIFKGSIHYEK